MFLVSFCDLHIPPIMHIQLLHRIILIFIHDHITIAEGEEIKCQY